MSQGVPPNREARRLAGTVTALATCVLCLTGCDAGIYQSPGGIRLDGEHVEIVLCETVTGAELRVFGDAARGDDAEDYMRARGDIGLPAQQPLSSAEPRADWDVSVWSEPNVNPGARVALFVYDSDGDVAFPIEFTIPEQGLSQTLWTRADGSQHENACG